MFMSTPILPPPPSPASSYSSPSSLDTSTSSTSGAVRSSSVIQNDSYVSTTGTRNIVGFVVAAVILFKVIGAIVFYLIWKKRKEKPGDPTRFGSWLFGVSSRGTKTFSPPVVDPGRIAEEGSVHKPPESSKAFTYEELKESTNGFCSSNLLGEGGFGRVYKGTIAGNPVAVKQLKVGGDQGEREFRAEVDIISRVHHRHLVSLVGYCISGVHRLLVYNYVPNGTLEEALHGPGKPVLDWATRLSIALGTARGLAYLHEDCNPRIIHRDIKGSNILLDNHWEAQVSDFGLAKLADDAQTHITTRVMGTFGYVAPEYAMSGKLTDKSDVYSFGVILLQLITGKKPVDKTLIEADGEESLVEWARPRLARALETGNVDVVADPNLLGKYDSEEMLRMVEVAATCVRHSSQKRPKMVEALRSLGAEGRDLHQGVSPGHSKESAAGEASKDHLRRFRQLVYDHPTTEGDSKSEEQRV